MLLTWRATFNQKFPPQVGHANCCLEMGPWVPCLKINHFHWSLGCFLKNQRTAGKNVKSQRPYRLGFAWDEGFQRGILNLGWWMVPRNSWGGGTQKSGTQQTLATRKLPGPKVGMGLSGTVRVPIEQNHAIILG